MSRSKGRTHGAQSDVEVSRVPPELAEHVFARLEAPIQRGLRHGAGDCTTAAHVLEQIKAGDFLLWAVHDETGVIACVVLSVRKHPAKTTVYVELTAGKDLGRWVGRIETLLSDFKTLVGADTVEATCRDGMTKRLMDRGWRRKATIVELM